MSKLLRYLSLPGLALVMSVFVVGCNTMEGAGEDIQAGGRAVEDTARDVKN